MKNLILICLFLSLSHYGYGIAELCPGETQSGGEGCFMVDEVFQGGDWVNACCGNIEAPAGFSCVGDDCAAKRFVSKVPALSIQNGFLLYTQGYQTWTIINGEVKREQFNSNFDIETMRSYLPVSRLLFLKNPNMTRILFTHSDDIKVVVQRPGSKEELLDEIIFPERVSGKELERFLKEMDNKALKVYPNPARETLSAEFANSLGIAKMEVISIDGKIQMCKDFDDIKKEASISLTSIEPGSYLIRIYDQHGRLFSRTVMKE